MKKLFLIISILYAGFINAQCVSTIAGSTAGYSDGTGTSAMFNKPYGVAVDGSGNVFVADQDNHRIRKITSSGVVTTIAGSTQGYADGTGTAAKFNSPCAIDVDIAGNLYVADASNSAIRKITPSGVVSTIANFTSGVTFPTGITVDFLGNVYYTDDCSKIFKITPSGVFSTFAGTTQGFADGTTTPKFNCPRGITFDGSGNLYVADQNNNRIRKITSSGVVTTLAGSGTIGSADGIGISAQFSKPQDIAIDGSGNLYIGGGTSLKIRKITPSGVVSTLAGMGPVGSADGNGNNATFNFPSGVAIDALGNLYVADVSNHKIRKVIPNLSASIGYSGSPFCKTLTLSQPVSLTGTGTYTGGTFTSTSGLSLNSSTGAIIPSTTTAGSYTITYTTSASSGCAYTSSTQATITALPTVAISYLGSPFCKSLTSARPVTLSGTGAYTGGTFSSTSGLSLNSSTGAITPSTSTPGTYTVTYTSLPSGGCSAVIATTQITITALSTASINYSGSPFCKSLTTPQIATLSGTGAYTGGTFSSTPGLSINTSTGAVIPSTSNSGNYNVTYTIPATGGCSAVLATTQIVILSVPAVSISADGTIATSISINNGNAVQLQLNGSLGTTPNIQWTPSSSISSSSISNPIVYPNTTTTYTASFTNTNGCQQSTSININVNPLPTIGNISLVSNNTTIGLFDTSLIINVQLSNVTNLYSLYMKLKGNAAVNQYLDYNSYTAGTLLGSGNSVISTPPTVTSGVPDFGISKIGTAPGYNGSGLFYTLRFKPKNNITIPNGTVFCFYLDDINANNASGVTCGLNNQGLTCFNFTYQVNVWPGDLNNSKTVSTADLLPIGYFYNSIGPVRPNATIQWYAQPATLWGYNNSSINGDAYKVFADANGDGVINNADQAAIGFNMNQIHAKNSNSKYFSISPNVENTTLAGGMLVVAPNSNILDASTLPQTVTFNVELNNTGGLNALYGISVNHVFDSTIFDLSTANIDYAGSIFGIINSDFLNINYNTSNAISVGLTRYANAPINGQGLLYKLTLKTKTSLGTSLTQTPVISYVDAANSQSGDTLGIEDAMIINLTIINNNVNSGGFVIYPNPVKDFLIIKGNTVVNKVTIFNSLGQKMFEKDQNNNEFTVDVTKLSSGIYFINVESDNKKQVLKVIKE
jgi:sugar lactone lactonase YvrE